MEEKHILEVKNLSVTFRTSQGNVAAADNVSFYINQGETFALVGESGCGKSTTARSIMGLIHSPGEVSGDGIFFDGVDLSKLKKNQMAKIRGKRIGMIFQNPLDSLNPVYTIGSQITEGLMIDGTDRETAEREAVRILREVKISDAQRRMKSYPHEISGGMRQRVMIAMMLVRNPELLIADEPTTALDVTIQAEILELMRELKEKFSTSLLLITHDFGVVADMADRVGVMYAGRLIETADVFAIFDQPAHPYTRLLMQALPTITKDEGKLVSIPGSVPNLADLGTGCHFADRCPLASPECREKTPEMKEIEPGHFCACIKTGRQRK